MSWAPWLLFTGVPARCNVSPVRCPGPIRSCSPVCPLGVLSGVCGVLGHLAAVHRCARLVHCLARAVSWATWLLFTGVLARRVVLRVPCPGPLCSCSPLCPRGVFLLRARRPAPLGSCSPGVLARCVVLRARCPGPLGPCSPVCSLGLLCCVCGVLGLLAPFQRCARSVCCAVCCVCSVLGLLAPVHRCARWVCCVACVGRCCGARTRPSGRRLYVAGRGCVPSGRALVHPSGGCLVAGRGWVRCWPATLPSRRRLFRSRQGLGLLPAAHTSIRTAAGVAWHLFACRGSLRVVRAVQVSGTRWPLLLGTCPCALVVVGGVPLWRASWPRAVRSAPCGPVALCAPVRFPDAVVP